LLDGEVSLALQHRADAVDLEVHVLSPGHLDALLVQTVHTDLLPGHGHACGLADDFQLAYAVLAGAELEPQVDQQI
jgi:hypothetical protein